MELNDIKPDPIGCTFKALYLGALHLGLGKLGRSRVRVEDLRNGPDKYRTYSTKGSRYPVVLLHGLSARGYDDHRLVSFARELALCGFKAYTPDLTVLTRLDFDLSDIRRIVDLIGIASKDGPKVGIMGFSVGASYGLIAASDEKVRDRIGYVMAAGGYYSFERLVENALNGPGSDIYARLVLAYGAREVLHLPEKDLRDFEKVMMEYCLREHSFTDDEKTLIGRIGAMSAEGEVLAWWYRREEAYSPLDLSRDHCLSRIDAPVFLLHATGDRLIPSQETDRILKELRERGKKVGVNLNESEEHLSYVGSDLLGLFKILKSIMRIREER